MGFSEDVNHGQQNEVYIDTDGFLHLTYNGSLDEVEGMEMYHKTMALAEKQLGQGRKIKVLADVTNLSQHTPGSRRAGFLIREHLPFEKMAIIFPATNPSIKRVSEILSSAFTNKEIKSFRSEVWARKWLRLT